MKPRDGSKARISTHSSSMTSSLRLSPAPQQRQEPDQRKHAQADPGDDQQPPGGRDAVVPEEGALRVHFTMSPCPHPPDPILLEDEYQPLDDQKQGNQQPQTDDQPDFVHSSLQAHPRRPAARLMAASWRESVRPYRAA